MPTLDFKGKQFIYSHHHSVPFRELTIENEKSLPAKDKKPNLDDNLIINGDNLHALKALMPLYAGKVKCIYIDPPYNTGNEGWCYNDNVNSPLMKEWLAKNASPVDKEDLQRHDKWLCMMYPRLKLLHELLADDGAIFISIGDNEVHHLRAITDEIFGEDNFVGSIARQAKKGGNKGDYIKPKKDYVLFYFKFKNLIDKKSLGADVEIDEALWLEEKFDGKLRKYKKGDIPYREKLEVRSNQRYYIEAPDGSLMIPKGNVFPAIKKDGELIKPLSQKDKCWTWSLDRYFKEKVKSRFLFVKSKDSAFLDENGNQSKWSIYKKVFESDLENKKEILSDIILDYTNSQGTKEIEEIFGAPVFNYPKPSALIKHLIGSFTDSDDIILDSFAGSGTTAQAVLGLNKSDGGDRKFILVQIDEKVQDDSEAKALGYDAIVEITAERVRRVINGVPNSKDEKLKNGLGGSFTFCKLGDEFNIEKILTGEALPKYESLANYVFYTATGKSLETPAKQRVDYFVGETDLYEVYLIYQADIAFLRSNESALNSKIVEAIGGRGSKKQKLVFASAKYMGQNELNDHKIIFCQLPYAIHKIAGK